MILSIDIGGTYIKYAILSDDYIVQSKWRKRTNLYPCASQFYDYLCEDLKDKILNVTLIGISMPGILNPSFKVVSKTSDLLELLYGSYVTQEISNRCEDIPSFAINDARAAGFCEVSLGNGRGSTSSVYWIIGTGIGGAIFKGDELIEGKDNLAGEFSHIPVKMKDGKTFGLARQTSISGLISLYNSQVPQNKSISLGEIISNRAQEGESLAQNVIDDWIDNNAQALLMLIFMFNPEIICIGGAISEDKIFMERLKDRIYHTIKYPFSDLITTKIETCLFKNDSNLIGAAIFAKKREIEV
ncbi:ROK family protein [Enterococcus avium]|uniref:ROK family protein n=1 Tax=Enterococcus TaxID=1350 RepID=UPI001A9770DB|nr:ROK family protein [Enterococcus avium]MBO1139875.1 ROK family protein [Enterococcus avium]